MGEPGADPATREALSWLLGRLEASRDTPLRFGAQVPEIAAGIPEPDRTATGELDALVRTLTGGPPIDAPRRPHALHAWIEALAAATGSDHRATRILTLRCAGYGPREVATELGLGLRLTQRILHEIGAGLGAAQAAP